MLTSSLEWWFEEGDPTNGASSRRYSQWKAWPWGSVRPKKGLLLYVGRHVAGLGCDQPRSIVAAVKPAGGSRETCLESSAWWLEWSIHDNEESAGKHVQSAFLPPCPFIRFYTWRWRLSIRADVVDLEILTTPPIETDGPQGTGSELGWKNTAPDGATWRICVLCARRPQARLLCSEGR